MGSAGGEGFVKTAIMSGADRSTYRVPHVKKKSTVLVIDDYPSARDAVSSALKGDFDCLSAESARGGLEILVRNPVDAVVLDIQMPEMDGIEVLKRIKEMGINTQVILLTGHGSLETAKEAVRYGAFDYLIKPFDIFNLREVVAGAVEKKRLLEREGKDDRLEKVARALTTKLAEASRLARVSELSSEALTEMKNPLTAILGYTQMILKKIKDRRIRFFGAKPLQYLSIIEEEALRCVEIASRLASAPEKGRDRSGATVNEILLNVVALLRPQCSMSGIDFVVAPLQEKVIVDLHADDLHAVLINLVLNSMEAIEGPGEISMKGYKTTTDRLMLNIASQSEEQFLQHLPHDSLVGVEVSDTGRGIDKPHLERIFEPFFTTKTDTAGAGLGLSICKEKIEGGGGHIGVVRSRPGRTTMRILLPISSRV